MSKIRLSQGDKENQSFNQPKKLKRNTTNENLVLCASNVESNKNGEKNIKLIETKDLKPSSTKETKCEDDFIKLEFEINNGDYVIYEYCSELVRQVQQAKEEEIERIENLAETLMKEIGDYKKEITENYLNDKTFKSKFMQRLNLLKDEASSSTPNDLEFKIKAEKSLIQKSIFNGKLMKFDKAVPQKQPIGKLEINEDNVIDADLNLVTTAHLNIPNEAKTDLDINKCVYYKYFGSGECFLAFETNCLHTFNFYVLNKDKTIKTTQKNIKAFGQDYLNTFHIFRDKLAFHQNDGKVLVYDNNLKLLKKYENIWRFNPISESEDEEDDEESCNRLESKNVLIGADENCLYFANEDNEYGIEVCDWSFNFSHEIAVGNYPTYEFYLFRLHKDIYYFIDGSLNLNLVKRQRENKLLKTIENVSRYEIDSNGNLIVFYWLGTALEMKAELKKRMVGFYDLNGEHKYDLKLVNFYKNLKEEDFPTWDDFEITYDNWIHSMTIEKSGQRHLSFFDRESFSFKDVVPDEFVATEIELKHN